MSRAAATLPTGATCLVDFDPWENWKSATAVALELERLGHRVRVNETLKIMFGVNRSIQRDVLDQTTPLVRWMIVPESTDPARLSGWPLLKGASLEVSRLADVNPATQHISFLPDGNCRQYAFYGWSFDGADWSWSDQQSALLAFHALPLPREANAGVELLISAWNAPLPNPAGLQRMAVRFNGEELGTFHLPAAGPDLQPLRVLISAAQWQRAAGRGESLLQFFFPDAKAPVGVGDDLRLIGGGYRSFDFRLVSPTPATVSLPEAGSTAARPLVTP